MTTLTEQERESLLDALYEAKEHLNEAISLVDRYVRYTGDAAAEAYILDHLRILAGRDHGFLSGDMNLDDLLDSLDQADSDDDEDTTDQDSDEAPPTIVTDTGQTLYYWPTLGRYVTIPEDED